MEGSFEKAKDKYFELGAIELCALDLAFESPANEEALQEVRTQLPDTYTESKTKFFKATPRMSMAVSRFGDFIIAMAKIVRSEKDHLGREPDLGLLSCNHFIGEHKTALESILEKIESIAR